MQEIEDAAKACVCGNLRRTSRVITQFYDKQLGPSGITITQLGLLRTISIGNSSTISKVSKDMCIDRTTLTRNLDLLKKQDFIKVESTSDKRKRIVTITNRGKEQITKALPLWERAQGIIIEKFGKGNWREINTGLNEISNIARFN
jgi:DNA-binding MarR family transcriptional regulator